MAQNWDDILPTDTLRDSRQLILNRDETLKSQFSGTTFPTTDLVIGMPCYRTDQGKLYVLSQITPTNEWEEIPLLIGGFPIPITQGGTGAGTAVDARTNLGLGALAVLNAVTETEIVDNSVSTNKLQGLAVTAAKLAVDAVETAKIKDLAVTTAKIQDEAVTAAKLAPGAVETFPTGTRMLFQQSSTPTGWTKELIQNNKALRVVTGSATVGGTVAFTTALGSPANTGIAISSISVGSHVLTVSEMPAHTHDVKLTGGSGGNTVIQAGVLLNQSTPPTLTNPTLSEGGGGGHVHPSSGGLITSQGTTPINVQYVDVIIGVKD